MANDVKVQYTGADGATVLITFSTTLAQSRSAINALKASVWASGLATDGFTLTDESGNVTTELNENSA